MKTTQYDLILDYVRLNGEINPSHFSDSERKRPNGYIGSELGKRCRELRAKGILDSHMIGKYVVYVLPQNLPQDAFSTENVQSSTPEEKTSIESNVGQIGGQLNLC